MLEVKTLCVQLGVMEFGFDLELKQGERLAILGPSGAGKSTLLNLIGGFLSPSRGELRFNGIDILQLNAAERPVTTLFQDHNLFSHLCVSDNVGLGLNPGLRLSTEEQLVVSNTLAQVGLDGFEERKATNLSGGQAQRVALARCLIRNKPILLLDEPFSALDKPTRLKMLELTKTIIIQNNISSLFVTHNEEDATQFATRTIRVVDGATVENSQT